MTAFATSNGPILETTARPSARPLPQHLVDAPIWTDEDVVAAGLPIHDRKFVTIGGGIGSFVLVDYLRIAGVPTSDIGVLSNIEAPWETYEYLTRVSQIPRAERLRSDSSSCPDNIWGFPSYAVREAAAERTLKPLVNVLVEPILSDYWTPRAGTAFRALAREAARIEWDACHVSGEVSLTRRRHGGGYFSVLTGHDGHRHAYRSRVVHVAIGYPGLRYLDDLQEHRTRTGDRTRIVNAYENHEHVYAALRDQPGTVLVRGGGIVASRVLQRLMDDREQLGVQTEIHHLFRTYVNGSHGTGFTWRRKGSNGFAFQGFNWPKSAWGGQLKRKLDGLEGEQRRQFYEAMGGSHTPHRRSWEKQKTRARKEGWYRSFQGVVGSFELTDTGVQVAINRVTDRGPDVSPVAVDHVDYVIDCTGLEGDIESSRFLSDLLATTGAGRNPLGRLDVSRSFEIRGTDQGVGKMYASGAATLGGYYAGVDSFLGLQYAALAIIDDLARDGLVKRIGPIRSMRQWWRWTRNQPPTEGQR